MKDIIVYRDDRGEIVVSTDGGATVFEPRLDPWGVDETQAFDPARHKAVWSSGPGA